MPATDPGPLPRSAPPAQDEHETPEFASGTLINARYRIEALVGRGGMGDVYRAHDLTLSTVVALKFLPMDALRDPNAVKLFINEVRVARRVSHQNVCRVHDVEQFGDRWFISMEFVDGENLASLLQRIDYFPRDKGIALANQLCAGLAAAHDQGALHRDLKPTNILINSRGEAKIADFGLAGLLEELRTDRSRAGTPAYMSPEQLDGDPPSVRSDIYALGLVLFEVFTGHPVFRPRDMAELLQMHKRSIEPPSAFARGIEPGVEQSIMACLAPSPAQRPATALHVAAMLPGGNLLSAAMHAGLTPSPALVAAAGSKDAMPWSIAAVALGTLVALLLGVVLLSKRASLHAYVPLVKSAEVLAEDARRILRDVGYSTDTPHQVYAFDYYEELLDEMALADKSVQRWEKLRRERPSPIDFWYRQHVRPLVTAGDAQRVTMRDPAPVEFGMKAVRLDPAGRLRELLITTESIESLAKERPDLSGLPKSGRGADPKPLFQAAGLDIALFKSRAPERIPAVFADTRLAWEGVYPESPDIPINVEVAYLSGWPVSFRIVERSLAAASLYKPLTIDIRELLATGLGVIVIMASTIGAIVLAGQNIHQRRGDYQGALRIAVVAWALAFASFLALADHAIDFDAEVAVVSRAMTRGVLLGATTWLFYIATEPLVRRYWPESLIAWSRLLRGQWRDPLVGKNALAGAFSGVLALVVTQLHHLSPAWLGRAPRAPLASPAFVNDTLEGGRLAYGVMGTCLVDGLRAALFAVLALVLLRLLARSRAPSVWLFAGLAAVLWTSVNYDTPLSIAFGAAMGAIGMVLAVRFGVLALALASFVYGSLSAFPITLDFRVWYVSSTLLIFGVVLAIGFGGVMLATGTVRRHASIA